MMRSFLRSGLVILALLPAGFDPALAHAILVKGTPSAGATVDPGVLQATLRYNSRIDKARSRLTLIQTGGATQVLPISETGAVDTIEASATLTPGKYTLRWQVLAVDGHITRGDIPFSVRKGAGP